MIQAIEQVATAAEHRARFLAEAGVVRKTLLKSGKGYAVDDVHVYIGAARAFARRRRCTGRWHDAWRRLTPDVRGPRPLGRVGVSTGGARRYAGGVRPVLTHLALHVRDLDASIAFYRDFCGLVTVHERGRDRDCVVWLAEPGRRDLAFVLMPGGLSQPQAEKDYSHLGFALASRAAVDTVAERARALDLLLWAPREEPYPVGYYCGVRDPDGHAIEFSYGQPLPGAFSSGTQGGERPSRSRRANASKGSGRLK